MSLARSTRLFGISRQGVYQGEKRSAQRALRLDQVGELVGEQRRRMPRLGTRKLYYLIKPALDARGIKLGRDGLFAYLRSQHLLILPKKRYAKTTWSKHWLRKHPNLYEHTVLHRPEQVFVSDITYIKTKAGSQYLSLVTDAYSRKIMGYHLSADMHTDQVNLKKRKLKINEK